MNNATEKKKNYFTDELLSEIRSMTIEEMNTLLLDLENTEFWTAILKYLQERMIYVQNTLLITDAFKETGKICNLQGTMAGLSDLQNMVIRLKEDFERKEKEDEEKKA